MIKLNTNKKAEIKKVVEANNGLFFAFTIISNGLVNVTTRLEQYWISGDGQQMIIALDCGTMLQIKIDKIKAVFIHTDDNNKEIFRIDL